MVKNINSEKPDHVVRDALEDYKNPKLTTEDIATKHKVCAATLTVWVKKAGMRLRTRGRRKLTAPTVRHRKILELAQHLRYDQIGRQLGMQKQAVHRIVKRWKGWQEPQFAPFAPGDIVSWKGKRLTVIEANAVDGTLEDEKGKRYKRFTWAGGTMPKKIGVNDKYLKPSTGAA